MRPPVGRGGRGQGWKPGLVGVSGDTLFLSCVYGCQLPKRGLPRFPSPRNEYFSQLPLSGRFPQTFGRADYSRPGPIVQTAPNAE